MSCRRQQQQPQRVPAAALSPLLVVLCAIVVAVVHPCSAASNTSSLTLSPHTPTPTVSVSLSLPSMTERATPSVTATQTPSPTPSVTLPPTASNTATLSMTTTATVTPPPTRTATDTATRPATATYTEPPTRTATDTPTRTVTVTPAATLSATPLPSVSGTVSVTVPPTRTATDTATASLPPTRTQTATSTATFTASQTMSATASISRSLSVSISTTKSESATTTQSWTPSARTSSRSLTASESISATWSVSTSFGTATHSSTRSLSPSASATPSVATVSFSVSASRSVEPTPSPTASASLSLTATASESGRTPTRRATVSLTHTQTRTDYSRILPLSVRLDVDENTIRASPWLAATVAGANETLVLHVNRSTAGELRLRRLAIVAYDPQTSLDMDVNVSLAAPIEGLAGFVYADGSWAAAPSDRVVCVEWPYHTWPCAFHNMTVPRSVGQSYRLRYSLTFIDVAGQRQTVSTAANGAPTSATSASAAFTMTRFVLATVESQIRVAAARVARVAVEPLASANGMLREACVTVELLQPDGTPAPSWAPSAVGGPPPCVELTVLGTLSAINNCRRVPPQHIGASSSVTVCGFPFPVAPLRQVAASIRFVNADGEGSFTTPMMTVHASHTVDNCGALPVNNAADDVLFFSMIASWPRHVALAAPVVSGTQISSRLAESDAATCRIGANLTVAARRLDNCTVQCSVPPGVALSQASLFGAPVSLITGTGRLLGSFGARVAVVDAAGAVPPTAARLIRHDAPFSSEDGELYASTDAGAVCVAVGSDDCVAAAGQAASGLHWEINVASSATTSPHVFRESLPVLFGIGGCRSRQVSCNATAAAMLAYQAAGSATPADIVLHVSLVRGGDETNVAARPTANVTLSGHRGPSHHAHLRAMSAGRCSGNRRPSLANVSFATPAIVVASVANTSFVSFDVINVVAAVQGPQVCTVPVAQGSPATGGVRREQLVDTAACFPDLFVAAAASIVDANATAMMADVVQLSATAFDEATGTTETVPAPISVPSHVVAASRRVAAVDAVSGCPLSVWPAAALCVGGASITLHGAGFPTASDGEVEVLLSPADWTPTSCNVTSATPETIVCLLPAAPRGLNAMVRVFRVGAHDTAESPHALVSFALPAHHACFFDAANVKVCSGHGACVDSDDDGGTSGGASCQCVSNASSSDGVWTGERCDQCAASHNVSDGCAVPCPAVTATGGLPCNGHGTCANGTCVSCDRGWLGSDCGAICPSELTGVSCTLATSAACPACGGHGLCEASGSCRCDDGFCGPHCQLAGAAACASCPVAGMYGQSCDGDCLGGAATPCNGHGLCFAGRSGDGSCTCHSGFTGSACEQLCPGGQSNPCSGHGRCDSSTSGTCVCDAHFGLADCSAACPTGVPAGAICSGRGLCSIASPRAPPTCSCERGYTGPSCASACPGGVATPCNNRGRCNADGTCTCAQSNSTGHWAGEACTVCSAEWFGGSCNVQCDRSPSNGRQCSGHGVCQGSGVCTCAQDDTHAGYWSGEICDQCAPGYHGAGCLDECAGGACTACGGKGTCFDGVGGSGLCTCYANATHGFWSDASNCSDCTASYFGSECGARCPRNRTDCGGHGVCNDGVSGTGLCTCGLGWARNANDQGECTACAPGYFGDACTRCALGAAASTVTCSGHGACADGRAGDGRCTCDAGHAGDACQVQCPLEAVSGAVCNGHGTCEATGCVCRPDWNSTSADDAGQCSDCIPGRYGQDCARVCPTCGAHGSCHDGVDGDGSCVCLAGFYGAACAQACPASADVQLCHGHGVCSGVTGCECFRNASHGFWAGVGCAECLSPFSGATCQAQCPTVGGAVCGGRGVCNATSDDAALSCTVCQPLPTDTERLWCGRACQQSGPDVCLNFSASCSPGRWGPPACSGVCPGGAAQPCSGRGVCHADTGVCVCDAGASFTDCSGTCPTAFVGNHEYACAGHGLCQRAAVPVSGTDACVCQVGWWGAACDSECPGGSANPCFGSGTCNTLSGECVCDLGFGGRECDVPCPAAAETGVACNGQGTCERDATCRCSASATEGFWSGDACERCLDGYGGGDCTQRCTAGAPTNGTACLCAAGVAGPTCAQLCPGFAAATASVCGGHGLCNDGSEGDASCRCDEGWYGDECLVPCIAEQTCLAQLGMRHAQCNASSGACECISDAVEGYWAGATCDSCVAGFWGPSCALRCPCNGNGGCDQDSGECACFSDETRGFWSGQYCGECAASYIGADCRGPNIEFSSNAEGSLRVVVPVRDPYDAPAVSALVNVTSSSRVLVTGASPLLVVNTTTSPPRLIATVAMTLTAAAAVTAVNATHVLVHHQSTSATYVNVVTGAAVAAVASTTAVPSQQRRFLLQTPNADRVTVDDETGFVVAYSNERLTFNNASAEVSLSADFSAIERVELQRIAAILYVVVAGSLDTRWRVAVARVDAIQAALLAVPSSSAAARDSFRFFDPRNAPTTECGSVVNGTTAIATCDAALTCKLHTSAGAVSNNDNETPVVSVACVMRRTAGAAAVGFSLPDGTTTADATNAVAARSLSLWNLVTRQSSGFILTATTAAGTGEGGSLMYAAFHRRAASSLPTALVNEPSRLVKWRLDDFRLTGLLSLGHVAGQAEIITAITPQPLRHELLVTVATPGSVALRSLNTFGVRAIAPSVIDAAGGATVTVQGEGFTDALGAASCDFGDDGLPVAATVVSDHTVTCVAPPYVNLHLDDCAAIGFNIRLGSRTTATSNVLLRRPDAAHVADINGSAAGAMVRAGVATTLILRGRGFVASAGSACRINGFGQPAVQLPGADVLSSTEVRCHLPPSVSPTRPPATVSFSHDGTAFSSSAAAFAVVGAAVGLAVRSPPSSTTAAIVVKSTALAALPAPVRVDAVDLYGNSVFETDNGVHDRALYVEALHEQLARFIDIAAANTSTASGAANATRVSGQRTLPMRLSGGVAVALVALLYPRQGTVFLRATDVALGWSAEVQLTVVVGDPASLSLASAGASSSNVTSTWRFGRESSQVLSPPPTVVVNDASGNRVRGEAVDAVPVLLSYLVTELQIVRQAEFVNDSFVDRLVTHRSFLSSSSGDATFSAVSTQGVHGRSYTLRFEIAPDATKPNVRDVAALELRGLTVEGCPGSELAVLNSDACVPCPSLAVCDGSAVAKAQPGVWRAAPSSSSFYSCQSPVDGFGACVGEEECEEGYQGPRCAVCAPGFGRNAGGCSRCTASALNWVLLVLFGLFVAFLVWGLIRASLFTTINEKKLSGLVKMFLSHLQLLSAAGLSGAAMPEFLQVFFLGIRSVAAPKPTFTFMSCEVTPTFYDTWLLIAVVPWALLAVFVVESAIRVACRQQTDEESAADVRHVRMLRDVLGDSISSTPDGYVEALYRATIYERDRNRLELMTENTAAGFFDISPDMYTLAIEHEASLARNRQTKRRQRARQMQASNAHSRTTFATPQLGLGKSGTTEEDADGDRRRRPSGGGMAPTETSVAFNLPDLTAPTIAVRRPSSVADGGPGLDGSILVPTIAAAGTPGPSTTTTSGGGGASSSCVTAASRAGLTIGDTLTPNAPLLFTAPSEPLNTREPSPAEEMFVGLADSLEVLTPPPTGDEAASSPLGAPTAVAAATAAASRPALDDSLASDDDGASTAGPGTVQPKLPPGDNGSAPPSALQTAAEAALARPQANDDIDDDDDDDAAALGFQPLRRHNAGLGTNWCRDLTPDPDAVPSPRKHPHPAATFSPRALATSPRSGHTPRHRNQSPMHSLCRRFSLSNFAGGGGDTSYDAAESLFAATLPSPSHALGASYTMYPANTSFAGVSAAAGGVSHRLGMSCAAHDMLAASTSMADPTAFLRKDRRRSNDILLRGAHNAARDSRNDAVAKATHRSRRRKKPPVRKARQFVELALTTGLIILFLLFPTLVEVNGEMLRCEDIDLGLRLGTHPFLIADRSIRCDTEEHARYTAAAMAQFFGYIVLVPLLGVAVVKGHALATGDMSAARKAFFFLTGGLKPERWFWESWSTIRKAAVVVVSLFIADLRLRLYVSMWFIGGCVVVSTVMKPFLDPRVARLELVSLAVIFATFNLSLLLGVYDPSTSSFVAVATVILVINTLVICGFVVAIAYVVHVVVLETLRDRGWHVKVPKGPNDPDTSSDDDDDDDAKTPEQRVARRMRRKMTLAALEERTEKLQKQLAKLQAAIQNEPPHPRLRLMAAVIVEIGMTPRLAGSFRLQQAISAYAEVMAFAPVRLTGFNSGPEDTATLFKVERRVLAEFVAAERQNREARMLRHMPYRAVQRGGAVRR